VHQVGHWLRLLAILRNQPITQIKLPAYDWSACPDIEDITHTQFSLIIPYYIVPCRNLKILKNPKRGVHRMLQQGLRNLHGHENSFGLEIYLISPCSRVLLEKLTGFQLVKKFPAFYGTRSFITAFTSARHLSLPWASSIQSIPPHHTS